MAEIVTNQSDEKKEAIHAYPHTHTGSEREKKRDMKSVLAKREKKIRKAQNKNGNEVNHGNVHE